MIASNENSCDARVQSKESKLGQKPESQEDWVNHQHLKQAIRRGDKETAKRLLQEGVPVNIDPNLSYDYHRITPLHLAVHLGCLDLIKNLLDLGASVDTQDIYGETPLVLSVTLKKYAITDLLLTSELVPLSTFNYGPINHLHIACWRNNISAVKRLIALGANVNDAVDSKSFYWPGYTALHFAVEGHAADIVQLLVDNGADIMKKNAHSLTPLHLADEVRDVTIIDILLSAQMFELGNPEDGRGLSHFHIACTRNNVDVVRYFIAQGVDITAEISSDDVSTRKWSEYEPLTLAIYYECQDVVELLLIEGASLRRYCHDVKGYLEIAYQTGNERIIHLLLTAEALEDSNLPKSEILSKFQLACLGNDVEKMEKLLSRRKKKFARDLNLPMWNGCTPLHITIKSLPGKMMKMFRDLGSSVSLKNGRNETPLHVLFKYCPERIKEFNVSDLLDFQKNPSDDCGLSHFHILCTTDQVSLIEKFIENGVDINSSVHHNSLKYPGFTALHFAVDLKQLQTADVLLRHGAKIFLKNSSALTPFDMAIMNLNKGFSHHNREKEFEIVQRLLLEGENCCDFDRRGFSLLHILCATQRVADVSLLEKYADSISDGIDQSVNFPDSQYHQFTSLHMAMDSSSEEIAKWLIQRGANVHLKNNKGFSAVQYDIDSRGRFGILRDNPELLRIPGNPEDIWGCSYFHIGCIFDDRETMEYYLQSGVDVNLRTRIGISGDCGGKTPLHSVLRNARSQANTNVVDTVQFLLDNGADVMARNAYSNTPLHCCAEGEVHQNVMKLLIDYGADVNAQNMFGETPLLLSCRNSFSSEEIATLLKNGADINIADRISETPLTDACEMYINGSDVHDELVCMLLRHVKKLTVMGLYISKDNLRTFTDFLNSHRVDFEGNFRESLYKNECLREIELMKKVKINQYTTLYDILSKNPNEMAYLSQNPGFCGTIDSDNFVSKFLNYGYLIRLQYKRGLIRKSLLEKCKISLYRLARLTAECSEKISEYLDDDDLQNIIKSEKTILSS